MTPARPVVRLRAAREPVDRARRFLLEPTPRNLALCQAALAEAVQTTERAVSYLQQSGTLDDSVRTEALELRREIGVVAALLEHGAQFHAGLLQAMLMVSGDGADSAGACHPAPHLHEEA